MTKILMVLSGGHDRDQAGGSRRASGYWAEEFVVPHQTFLSRGFDVDIATPRGAPPVPDPRSLSSDVVGERAAHYRAYLAEHADELAHPLSLSAVDVSEYAAVILPSTHGLRGLSGSTGEEGTLPRPRRPSRLERIRPAAASCAVVVRDGNVISGQDPSSSAELAEAVVEAVRS